MNATTIRIKPARKGLVVRDPETRRPLADKGENKPLNAYWIRRLNDGDVIRVNDKTNTKGGN